MSEDQIIVLFTLNLHNYVSIKLEVRGTGSQSEMLLPSLLSLPLLPLSFHPSQNCIKSDGSLAAPELSFFHTALVPSKAHGGLVKFCILLFRNPRQLMVCLK